MSKRAAHMLQACYISYIVPVKQDRRKVQSILIAAKFMENIFLAAIGDDPLIYLARNRSYPNAFVIKIFKLHIIFQRNP